tara:strand:- start:5365 stop:7332 length:1968 start_codon:yes stop_codon:yes gene_type:complete
MKKNIPIIYSKIKILIIYSYYEIINQTKNQSNLKYFLAYGMGRDWKEYNITTLIIINGKICELLIPEDENLIVLKREYNNEYCIETFLIGINYMENKLGGRIYNKFTHIFFLNSSVSGPFYEFNEKKHWIEPFLNKMKYENSVICSPVINFLKCNTEGGPGPICQTYCYLVKINKKIYELLVHTPISNLCPEKKNINYDLEYGNVLIGDYGFTRILLNNGFKISSLLYDNLDYTKKNNWNKYSDKIDRNPFYKDRFLDKCIFIKNVWKVSNSIRESRPVLKSKCRDIIFKNLNMKNIFDEVDCKYNYNFLDINERGNIILSNEKWENKKQFYEIFGESEEIVLWPVPKKENKQVAIYCHFDKDNIIKDYVIQGLKTLIILEYDIIFCTTSSEIKNIKLPIKINYFKNIKGIKSGNDLFMFYQILKKNMVFKYEWILFINDSILFPIYGIKEMKNTILKKRQNNDFWGLYLSNECSFIHLCSCFIEYNTKSAKILKYFYENELHKNSTSFELIKNIESIQTKFLVFRNLRMGYVISYKSLDYTGDSIMFNPKNTKKYINNKNCFGIKWKYIGNYLDYDKLNNPYLNFLLRFPKIIKNKFIPNIPNYFKDISIELFDYKFYKSYYKDLYRLNKEECLKHYISHGKNESRLFNKSILK